MIFKFSIVFIILTRLVLIKLPGFKIDMTAWQAWAARLYELGPANFYSSDVWTNYTPGYLFFLWVFGTFFEGILKSSVFTITFEYFLKFITNIFDLATCLLVYRILKKEVNLFWAKLGALAYLANPAVIFNSSVWGQIDGILTFFILGSFYLVYYSKKLSLSFLSLIFALLIKPQALALIPIYILVVLKKYNFRKILISIPLGTLLFFLTSLLFFPNDPLFGLSKLIIEMAKDYPYTGVYAFNLWALVGWWQNDLQKFIFLTYQQWGILVYLIALSIILFPFLRSKSKDLKQIFFSAALLILAFFLVPTRVHERYLFPFFAFFAITLSLYRSYFYLCIYLAFSIIHLLNLLYVYNYYMYIFDNPVNPKIFIYSLIDSIYPALSIISLTLFAILIVKYLRAKND